MDSSQFLRLSVKGGDRIEWIGDVQELDKFFASLHYVGTWREQTERRGKSPQVYKQRFHLHLVCKQKIPSNTGEEV